MLTEVPLEMAEHPGPQVAKVEANLATVGRAIYPLRLAYLLTLRIVLAYVVSAMDYVYEAMPPYPTRLRHTQRAVNSVSTRAPRVPRNVPPALWMPPPAGASTSHTYTGRIACAGVPPGDGLS